MTFILLIRMGAWICTLALTLFWLIPNAWQELRRPNGNTIHVKRALLFMYVTIAVACAARLSAPTDEFVPMIVGTAWFIIAVIFSVMYYANRKK